MEIIKIKVNLPIKVYELLMHDAKAFGFVKEDGTINKNKFINVLINNYFSIFCKLEEKVISSVNGQIKLKDEDYPLISSIYFETKYKKEGNYDKDLQFIVSKFNENIMDEILYVQLKNRSISQYFRDLFILYSSNISEDREKIIFSNVVNKIKDVIEDKTKAYIILKNNEKMLVDIFSLADTQEEIFCYVIGVKEQNDKRTIISLHLKDISNVIELSNQKRSFAPKEDEKLRLMELQNPAFAINEIYDCEIELTEVGVTLFYLWIHDRPIAYKIEGNRYFFKGSLTHIVIYFFKFAEEAKILSPQIIKEFIQDRYKETYEMYKNMK